MITDIDIEKLKKIFLQKVENVTQLVTSIIQWTNIIGKPTVFPPDTHTHTASDITDLNEGLVGTKEVDETNIGDDKIIVYKTASDTLVYETKPSGATDDYAIHDNVSGEISAITEKTTPVDDDILLIEDSEDSYAKKKVKFSNLPSGGGGGNKEIWLSGRIFQQRTDFGSPTFAQSGGNNRFACWHCAAGKYSLLLYTLKVPSDYTSGNITVKLYWTALTSDSSANVVWGVLAKEVNAGSSLNDTTSEISTIDTISTPAQWVLKISTHTVTITPSAAGVHIRMQVYRHGANAADTWSGTAGLLGVLLTYS